MRFKSQTRTGSSQRDWTRSQRASRPGLDHQVERTVPALRQRDVDMLVRAINSWTELMVDEPPSPPDSLQGKNILGTLISLGRGGVGGSGIIEAWKSMTTCDFVKVLGVTIDSKLSFDKHIGNICSAAFFHLQGLKHIRKSLDKFTAKSVACSIIGSRLDYCNAILAGVSEHSISRLQRVQNSAARVVLNVGRKSSATNSLRELHWLPVSHRIDFKISLLTFKALTSNEPIYLRSMLETHVPIRSTRSSTVHSLVQPFCDTSFASRAFNVYAPRLWNKLPSVLRAAALPSTQSLSVNSFKRSLKTLHFKSAFDTDLSTM